MSKFLCKSIKTCHLPNNNIFFVLLWNHRQRLLLKPKKKPVLPLNVWHSGTAQKRWVYTNVIQFPWMIGCFISVSLQISYWNSDSFSSDPTGRISIKMWDFSGIICSDSFLKSLKCSYGLHCNGVILLSFFFPLVWEQDCFHSQMLYCSSLKSSQSVTDYVKGIYCVTNVVIQPALQTLQINIYIHDRCSSFLWVWYVWSENMSHEHAAYHSQGFKTYMLMCF